MNTKQNNQTDSLVEYAYTEIRMRIQIGTYPPGTKLSSQRISDELNISRTPVVSALNRLVAEGIAEAVPRRGVFVMRLSSKKIQDLIEARIMLESYAAKRAADNVFFFPGITQNMKSLLSVFNSIGDHDYKTASETEFQFHYSIILLSGNEELAKMYRANWGIGATYYMYATANIPMSQRAVPLKEHQQLYDLLMAQDGAALGKALKHHNNRAIWVLNKIIDTQPDILGK